MVSDTETRTERGISLARGPALLLGTILLAAGLYFLYHQHTFPKFANFPDGNAPVTGKVLFSIFGANGWTGMLTAVAGGLLLFGAAQHLLAKTMSLIVGVALGAAAIIALASGNVLGLAAANGWTELAWGIAAAILLFNTIIPRRRRTVVAPASVGAGRTARGRDGAVVGAGAGAIAAGEMTERDRHRRAVAEREGMAERGPVAEREPVTERGPVAEREPVTEREAVAQREPVTEREAVAEREPVTERDAVAADQPIVDREAAARQDPSGASRP